MKRGTKLKSWKYSSILSFNVSLLFLEKAYGPVSLSMIVKGVMIVFFSLTLTLQTNELIFKSKSDETTYNCFPSSKFISLLPSLNVESMFRT